MNGVSPLDSLRLAIRQAGSQSALARMLGISQAAVSKWDRLGKHLPADHVLRVEELTGVSRHDLRPDIYPRDEIAHAPSAPPLIATDHGADA